MNTKELKEILESLDDDLEVYISIGKNTIVKADKIEEALYGTPKKSHQQVNSIIIEPESFI